MRRRVFGLGPAAVTAACAVLQARADVPPPPPGVAAIQECIKQIDLSHTWSFSWKLIEVGAPRHPRNDYEALYAPAGEARAKAYGYPVHVVYSVNGRTEIDAVYWLARDPSGHWQIPAVCRMP